MADTPVVFTPPLPSDDYLLVHLRTKEGHEYKLFLNGVCEGFPEGTLVVNRAASLYGLLFRHWE